MCLSVWPKRKHFGQLRCSSPPGAFTIEKKVFFASLLSICFSLYLPFSSPFRTTETTSSTSHCYARYVLRCSRVGGVCRECFFLFAQPSPQIFFPSLPIALASSFPLQRVRTISYRKVSIAPFRTSSPCFFFLRVFAVSHFHHRWGVGVHPRLAVTGEEKVVIYQRVVVIVMVGKKRQKEPFFIGFVVLCGTYLFIELERFSVVEGEERK